MCEERKRKKKDGKSKEKTRFIFSWQNIHTLTLYMIRFVVIHRGLDKVLSLSLSHFLSRARFAHCLWLFFLGVLAQQGMIDEVHGWMRMDP
jgi:hypothetical protein